MNRTTVLVPVSLAAGRNHAFDHGVAVGRSTGADLHLLHAVRPDLPFSFRAPERHRWLARLAHRARVEGLTVRVTEQHGDPAEVLVVPADAMVQAAGVDGTKSTRVA